MELKNDFGRDLLYFAVFLVFGMTIGMAGPTLMELLLIYFDNLDVINGLAWLLFSQALTRFVGAIAAGLISDRLQCNYNLILFCCLLSNGLLQVVIPLSRRFWILVTLTAISGIFVGAVDTVTNIVLISLHGIKVSPYLQCLYFCYGFGAFMSPLIAEPFLSEKTNDTNNTAIKTETAEMNDIARNNSKRHSSIVIHQALDKAPFSEPEYWSPSYYGIEHAFWIVAALHVPVMCGLCFIIIADKLKDVQNAKTKEQEISRASKNDEITGASQFDDEYGEENESFEDSLIGSERNLNKDKFNKGNRVLITVLTSIVVLIFDGLQGSFGGYIFTYAMEINMTATQGAILTSLFWGFLSIGRLFSIPLAVYFMPKSMLRLSLIFSLLSSVLMMLFHNSSLIIRLGTCFFALSMSNVFPCSLAMVEQYFPVTDMIACAFVVSAAMGETIIPLVVGGLFDRSGTMMFMGCVLFLCSLACLSFVVLTIMAKAQVNKWWEDIDGSSENNSADAVQQK